MSVLKLIEYKVEYNIFCPTPFDPQTKSLHMSTYLIHLIYIFHLPRINIKKIKKNQHISPTFTKTIGKIPPPETSANATGKRKIMDLLIKSPWKVKFNSLNNQNGQLTLMCWKSSSNESFALTLSVK